MLNLSEEITKRNRYLRRLVFCMNTQKEKQDNLLPALAAILPILAAALALGFFGIFKILSPNYVERNEVAKEDFTRLGELEYHSKGKALKLYKSYLLKQRDYILRNIINVKRPGYKRSYIKLEMLENEKGKHAVRVKREISFAQGAFTKSCSELNVGILGEGFFRVQFDGGYFYSRDGRLSINSNMQLCINRLPLSPEIKVPEQSSHDFDFRSDGRVLLFIPSYGGFSEIGRLQLYSFDKRKGLRRLNNGAFFAGEKVKVYKASKGKYEIHGAVFEQSNVELKEELRAWRENLKERRKYGERGAAFEREAALYERFARALIGFQSREERQRLIRLFVSDVNEFLNAR